MKWNGFYILLFKSILFHGEERGKGRWITTKICPAFHDTLHQSRLLYCRPMHKGIQDSLGFCIPRRGFLIPGTGFQSFSVELGFWIPIVSGIPNSLSCIRDSGFHKQKFIGLPYLGWYMRHTAVIWYRARKVKVFNTVWLPEGIVL